MEETRVELLHRLKGGDQSADWEEFYLAYANVIVRYARKLGLDEGSAHDVLQETMVSLMGILKTFTYDRSKGQFRNFLLTIVHRSSLRAIRRRQKRAEVSVDATDRFGSGGIVDRLPAAENPVEDQEQERTWRESPSFSSWTRDGWPSPGSSAIRRRFFCNP